MQSHLAPVRSANAFRWGVRAWTAAGLILAVTAAMLFMVKAAPCGNVAFAAAGTCPAADSPVFARGFVGNEDGADSDSRVEGDTDANLLYVDAGADRVGIGTAAPGSKLTVSGTFAFTTLNAAANLNSQALTNANIDSGTIDGVTLTGGTFAGTIAGTPTFSGNPVTFSGSIATAGTVATTGEIRLAQNQVISGRNNANSANVSLFGWGTASADVLTLGQSTYTVSVAGSTLTLPTSGTVINWNAGDITLTHSANLLTLAGGDIDMGNNTLDNIGNGNSIWSGASFRSASTANTFDNLTTFTTGLAFTGTVATTGEVRLAQNQSINGRNNANSANVSLFGWGTASADVLTLGQAGYTVSFPGSISRYNAVATAGWGIPAIYGTGRATGQVAVNASVATYTVGASDGSFEVSCNVNVTVSTTHSFSCDVTYTDEGGTARTLILPMAQLGGNFISGGLITNGTGAGPYQSPVMHIRADNGTAITVRTSAGTYTTVTYNVEGVIKQVQ